MEETIEATQTKGTQPAPAAAPPPLSYLLKLALSGAIYLCQFEMGLGITFLSSSLLELRARFDTDIPTISRVFAVLTVSWMVGAGVGGVGFRWVNRQLAAATLVGLMGVGLICQGLVGHLWAFFIATAAYGLGCGGFETAQLVWIIEMWGEEAGPYIQAQHFMYAIGAFVSPLLVKPFLAIGEGHEDPQLNLTALSVNSTASHQLEASRLYIPFLIGGLIAFSGALSLLVLYFIQPYVKPPRRHFAAMEHPPNLTFGRAGGGKLGKWALVFLSGLFLCFYVGMEVGTCQFIATFAHFIDLRLSKPEGAVILSGVAGAFTVGRGIGIPLVMWLSPEALLIGSLVIVAVGNTVLIILANNSLQALWVAAILLGAGFATVFPSFYGYIEKHLRISNFIGAIFVEMGWTAVSIYPFIIGPNIEAHPFVMAYTNYFSLGMCTLVLAILLFMTRERKQNFQERQELSRLKVGMGN